MERASFSPETTNYKADKIVKKFTNGAFLERFGVGADEIIEYLTSEPETPLNDEQKMEIQNFEQELLSIEVSSGETIKEVLSEDFVASESAPTVFAYPIVENKIEISGVENQEFESQQEFYQWFAQQLADGAINSKQALEIATSTQKYYQKNVSEKIVNNQEIEPGLLENHQFVIEEEKLIDQLQKQREVYHLIKDLKSELSDKNELLSQAELAYCEIINNIVNDKIFSRTTHLITLYQQSQLLGDQYDAEKENVKNLIPKTLRRSLKNGRADQILQMSDLYRNGADKRITADRIFHKRTPKLESQLSKVNLEPIFDEDKIEIMRSTYLKPEEIKEM